MKEPYFVLSGDFDVESLDLLDSLKVITFLIVFSKDKEQNKISAFVNTIIEESKGKDFYLRDVSDYDISASDNAIEFQFHKKEPRTLEVLSLQLAGTILPFISFCKDDEGEEDYDTLVKLSTTNGNIFYDFARYINKNYLFSYLLEGSKSNYHGFILNRS